MSGAISPSARPSLSFRSPASSSRTSLDLPPSASNSISRVTTTRRNRAALRDYYKIKPTEGVDASSLTSPRIQLGDAQTALSDLDKEGFDAGSYVRRLLEREGLEGILKVENELVGEIRGLDGERKALVYDNYSRLISATDTIKNMRTNMDPLTPTTSTLAPAISHIAETATLLSSELAANVPAASNGSVLRGPRERQTVQWVLDAPERLEHLLLDDQEGEARKEWETVQGLLSQWRGVEGVEDIRLACEKVVGEVDD